MKRWSSLLVLSVGALVAGAARPAQAQVTSSIPDAILGKAPPPSGQTVTYLPGDAATKGYLAVPKGTGPFPALILIHEWNGLVDRVRQVADAFAAQGYVTLAADLYQGRTGSNQQENMKLVQETRDHMPAVIANLNAAQQYLRKRQDVSGKVGVMGWCFGGGIALSYGLGGDHHEATAMFYGSLVTDPAELAKLHHPLYGTFAGQDRGIPPEQVKQFKAALDAIGIDNDIHIYDPVGHGFWLYVDQDLATRQAPAQDAWTRLMAFLSRVLR
jgi:carboxymethylenebutenolidase